MSPGHRTLYSVLGVAPDAPETVIKAAFRALAKQYHPDGEGAGVPGSVDRFIELQEAYKVLSDAESRAKYDLSIVESADSDLNEQEEDEASIEPEEIWQAQTLAHPEIVVIHETLSLYSTALANRFRLAVINRECADDPVGFAAELDRTFFRKYFGEHPEVQELARRLLLRHERAAAKALNKAVRQGKFTDDAEIRRLVDLFDRIGAPKSEAVKQTGGTPSNTEELRSSKSGSDQPAGENLFNDSRAPTTRALSNGAVALSFILLPVAILWLTAFMMFAWDTTGKGTGLVEHQNESYSGKTSQRSAQFTSISDKSGLWEGSISVQAQSAGDVVVNSRVPGFPGTKLIHDRVLPTSELPKIPSPEPKSTTTPYDRPATYPSVSTDQLPYNDEYVAELLDLVENQRSTTLQKQARELEQEGYFSVLELRTDWEVCASALSASGDRYSALSVFHREVTEAKRRGLTVEKCRLAIAEKANGPDSNTAFVTANTSSKTALVGELVIANRKWPIPNADEKKDLASEKRKQRIALVIGNAAYKKIPWLENPDADARLMASALRSIGFDITIITDATHSEMQRGLEEFSQNISEETEVALVFYAGHAVEIASSNYLLPTDIDNLPRFAIPTRSLGLGEVLSTMEARGVTTKIVVLDACRNNPFEGLAGLGGLAPVIAPSGTFIAYATAPGTVAADGGEKAGNSPYSAALAKALRNPALSIEETFRSVRTEVMRATNGKQVPWESSSLLHQFSFMKKSASLFEQSDGVRGEPFIVSPPTTRDPQQ